MTSTVSTTATATVLDPAALAAVELVVLDLAGTTVRDDGVVERAFAETARRTGIAADDALEPAMQYVRDTMGQSKIEVFRSLAGGDEPLAQRANEAFEAVYAEFVRADGVEPMPGAAELIDELRASGRSVALTTGFSPVTRDAILDALGWRVDAALSPADAGRGRPAPDLVLAAVLATRASSVGGVLVAGDTESDMGSGRNAGAGIVVGVTSGAHDRARLESAGADVVLDGVEALRAPFAAARP